MIKVLLIDDEKEQYDIYRIILKEDNIDLILLEEVSSFKDIYEYILKNEIKFVLIDYKLDMKYDFKGSELISYLNNVLPDLQCLLFTAHSPEDDLVLDRLKVEKSVLNSNDHRYKEFINSIEQGAKVFENRMQNTIKEYKRLYNKKKKSKADWERFHELYLRLVSYGYVERLPKEFFKKDNLEEKIDTLIEEIGVYLNDSH